MPSGLSAHRSRHRTELRQPSALRIPHWTRIRWSVNSSRRMAIALVNSALPADAAVRASASSDRCVFLAFQGIQCSASRGDPPGMRNTPGAHGLAFDPGFDSFRPACGSSSAARSSWYGSRRTFLSWSLVSRARADKATSFSFSAASRRARRAVSRWSARQLSTARAVARPIIVTAIMIVRIRNRMTFLPPARSPGSSSAR